VTFCEVRLGTRLGLAQGTQLVFPYFSRLHSTCTFKSQLGGTVNDKHDGYLLRPRSDACRCDKAVRSLSSRSAAPRPAQIIREGETVYKVGIGLCLG
jgi:hypothetical protein